MCLCLALEFSFPRLNRPVQQCEALSRLSVAPRIAEIGGPERRMGSGAEGALAIEARFAENVLGDGEADAAVRGIDQQRAAAVEREVAVVLGGRIGGALIHLFLPARVEIAAAALENFDHEVRDGASLRRVAAGHAYGMHLYLRFPVPPIQAVRGIRPQCQA